MNPLVLGLALATPAAGHHPYPPGPPPVVFARPAVALYAPPPPAAVARPVVYTQPVVVQAPPVVAYAPPPAVAPALTLDQFSRCFRPTPGTHHVTLVHPVTCQPVSVCFTLPEGKLKEFEVNRRSIEFDFDRCHDVKIFFRHNGTVDVRDR